MISFTLDTVKFLLIFTNTYKIHRFKAWKCSQIFGGKWIEVRFMVLISGFQHLVGDHLFGGKIKRTGGRFGGYWEIVILDKE